LTGEIIPGKLAQVDALNTEAAAITVTPVDISAEQTALDAARSELSALVAEIARTETSIEHKRATLADIDARVKQIETRRASMTDALADLDGWKRIDSLLAPNKLPAMELEGVLDSIDAEATRCIKPYRGERYIFESRTQNENEADKFCINVIDRETGRKRSMLSYSVGEKSFLTDAYTKSLIRMRKSRNKTSYSPIVLDESDGAIDIPSMAEYYTMQKNYFEREAGASVLVITHSPESGAFINNHVEMKELVK